MAYRTFCGWLSVLAMMMGCASISLAAPSTEQLLPNTTKGVVFIPNWDELETAFDSTQFGQLLLDPVMKPFYDDLQQQLREKGNRRLEKLGVTVDEIRKIPGGEIALAVVQPAPGTGVVVLIVDVTGREAEAAALRQKISQNLAKQGAKRTARATADLVEFELPKKADETTPQVAVNFLRGNTLVLADDYNVAAAIFQGVANTRKDSLANLPAFQVTTARLKKAAAPLNPHVRWFLEPFGFTEAMRVINPPKEKSKKPDLLKILAAQGFTSIRGLGGFVNFADGTHELLHRTFVYAPAVPGKEALPGGQRFNLAARMLDFPNSAEMPVQNWVPREIATYNTLNWQVQRGFAASETLVDEYMGEKGVFREVLDSTRDDKDGPRVDIEKELVANLGQRITLITDYQLPIGPKSERLLFAVETTNEAAVALAVAKSMRDDPAVKALDVRGNPKDKKETSGVTIWEVTNEQATNVPELQIETPGGAIQHTDFEPTSFQQPAKPAPGRRRPGRRPNGKAPNAAEEKRAIPNSAVCVVHGHMFVSSHKDFLIKVLDHITVNEQPQSGIVAVSLHPALETSADVNMVLMEMEQGFELTAARGFATNQHCLRIFSRTDEEFRPTYELFRNGQMPQSQSMLGKALNQIFGDGKEGSIRQPKLNGAKLPDFDVVRRYLGPAGAFMIAEPDGWFLTGFTLRKQVNSAEASPATRR
ncbi:MAG: hypothetical protein SFX18_17060 [Pirellulales bacterium]|nr:hypothetical protein [Pirellulales bacterium]